MKTISKIAVALFITSALVSGAVAGPKPASCPVCKMALAIKKTKSNTVAVKLTKKGKTMYCCAHCKMPASVLVKGK